MTSVNVDRCCVIPEVEAAGERESGRFSLSRTCARYEFAFLDTSSVSKLSAALMSKLDGKIRSSLFSRSYTINLPKAPSVMGSLLLL